ncbi:hypothetical protein JCM5350_000846 [Sporobolomyces pararoseus]
MPQDSSTSSHRHKSSRSDRDRSRSPGRREGGEERHRSHRRSDKDRERDSTSSRKERDRSRSRSPRRDHHRDSKRSRRERDNDSESEEEESGPPQGVDEIGVDDFFIKATELKLWLWEEKGKKLDSLKNEDARRYFKKFCRAWNRGRLSDNFYSGISPASLPSSISTSHSWSFSSKASNQRDLDAAASVRKSIDTGTKERSYQQQSTSSSINRTGGSNGGVVVGPTLPPSSAVEALQLERENLDRIKQEEKSHRDSQRKKSNRESREEERDSRATGKDRLVEKRREYNSSRKEFEASRESGGIMEVPDEVLMGGGGVGGGGSFQDALRERERARERREGRKQGFVEEKKAAMSDKFSAYKQKEDATMAQFRALAAQRFGPQPPQ